MRYAFALNMRPLDKTRCVCVDESSMQTYRYGLYGTDTVRYGTDTVRYGTVRYKILHLHDAKRYDLKKISKGLFISLLYKLNQLNSNFHSEFVCLVSILKLNLKTVDYRFNFFPSNLKSYI